MSAPHQVHHHHLSSSHHQLPPAQPVYVLRGHSVAIHALHFFRDNLRLATGDADGWLVVWDLPSKRPAAVWKAHENALLGVATWGDERLMTHGRDNKLYIWHIPIAQEQHMSSILPIDDPKSSRHQPWLLHALDVNALNFCCFAMCHVPPPSPHLLQDEMKADILVALPSALDSDGIDLFRFPSEHRVNSVPGETSTKTGMVMALRMFHDKTHLFIAAGYESGHTVVFQNDAPTSTWNKLYMSQPHTQPVLSLDIHPSRTYYLTSSADSLVIKHPLPVVPVDQSSSATTRPSTPLRILQSRHAGQQSLTLRSPDGLIFATAGWDSRVRVYSSKNLRELAVLKWHTSGCYAVAFAAVAPAKATTPNENHGERSETQGDDDAPTTAGVGESLLVLAARGNGPGAVTLSAPEQRRREKAMKAHWLAAGAKDGKVSLWDIF